MKETGKERWRKREETPTRRIWISCELASAENWSILSCEGTRAANQGKRTCPMVYSPSVAARRASNRFGPMQRRYNALGLSVSWATTISLPYLPPINFPILSTNIWTSKFLNSFIPDFLIGSKIAKSHNFFQFFQLERNIITLQSQMLELKSCFPIF